jgi:eukaryotic-like serine/threonine-protein kinase
MTFATGARLGTYEIVGPLGAGGMGEVYRARDSKLRREVAIKVLPETFSHDTERVARLRREAEMLASLNHSHIAAIYDIVESGTAPFLVLELVEGETLADRIARGPLPCPEALEIARQIAEALEAAHDKGIIHRDLKPANIKITLDGNVKVLDFGLAKVHASHADSLDLANSPTMLPTTPGLILGTAAYMSPEQANGRDADRTSDVWAFGCVLYEMLAGRRAFEGATLTEILVNVLKTEPDWRRLPVETPERIRRLLRRTLQKDQRLRFRDMRDARLEIDDVQKGTSDVDRVAGVRPRRGVLAWSSALALVSLIAGVLAVKAFSPPPTTPELRLEINTPPTRNATLAISPDGLKIVFVARSEGGSQLWLRTLDSSSARPLAGTERGSAPFWSPDSRSLGFYANAKLKRLDVDGGSLRTLAPAAVPMGGSWGSDGTILFGTNPGGPILRMSAEGGEPTAVTRIDAAQRGHTAPKILPDGRHFLFFAIGSLEARGVYVGQLDDSKTTRLFGADGPAVYASTGHLLFPREGTLWAQGFDPDAAIVRGEPFPIAATVTEGTTVSTSAAGPIAYRTAPPDSGQRQLVWVDRSGREIDKVIYPDTAALGPSLSPDGRRIAVYREARGNMDIWSYEITRRAWDRITFDLGDDIFPLWSRDGTSILFGGVRKTQGIVDLYRRLLSAPQGSEELVLSTAEGKFPIDLSPDGRFLLYDAFDPKGGSDVWGLPMEGNRKPFEIVRTDFDEGLAQFSPDGRWIAYQSDRTGRSEIYVRPFPGPGDESRVSIDGGTQARWNPKGGELFYIGADDRLMAMPIRIPANGKAVEPGVPRGLFATTVGSTVTLAYRQQYLVSADGQSFVMNSAVGEGTASPITLILNWKPQSR